MRSECVHAEVYSLLIDTYVRDPAERDHLFYAIETSELDRHVKLERD